MVARVGQAEQGKFFVVDVVLAYKSLYYCGNDLVQREKLLMLEKKGMPTGMNL